MLPSRVWCALEVLFCVLALATGIPGKKKNRRKPTEPPPPPSTPPTTVEPTMNMCDIDTPEIIYCYCDKTEVGTVSIKKYVSVG